MRQHATALITSKADFLEYIARNASETIMLCQPFIGERIVGIKQFQHAAVFVNQIFEEGLGLPLHRYPQRIIKLRVDSPVRFQDVHVSQLQPLAGKILDQHLPFWVVQHTPDLSVQHLRMSQFIPISGSE